MVPRCAQRPLKRCPHKGLTDSSQHLWARLCPKSTKKSPSRWLSRFYLVCPGPDGNRPKSGPNPGRLGPMDSGPTPAQKRPERELTIFCSARLGPVWDMRARKVGKVGPRECSLDSGQPLHPIWTIQNPCSFRSFAPLAAIHKSHDDMLLR